MRHKRFVFVGYQFDTASGVFTSRYRLDDQTFTDTITFGFKFAPDYSQQALDAALFGLFVINGVSYYKAGAPHEIVFEHGGLTKSQKEFFDKIYLHGLGEYWHQNDLDPRGRIDFPADNERADAPAEAELSGVMVPIAGGKDSLVSAGLLEKSGKVFDTWTFQHSDKLGPLLSQLGGEHLPVTRKIDPKLLTLNEQGAYNGHVPFSAILAFLTVVSAVLRNKRDIVLSNEGSAEEPSTEFYGMEINHQYSKTLEFERDFQAYVSEHISPSIRYFSFLRPLSELRIAEVFCQNWLEQYAGSFTSCNNNFKSIHEGEELSWCGRCAKCAFVFAIFAPFLPKERLVALFGKNLFTEPALKDTYEQLLGLKGHKPFDCVGEIEEVITAMRMAHQTGEYPELDSFTIPDTDYDYKKWHPDSMPGEYRQLLESQLSDL